MRCFVVLLMLMLPAGCTVIDARVDATVDGITFSAGVAGVSTEVRVPLLDLLPDDPAEVDEPPDVIAE